MTNRCKQVRFTRSNGTEANFKACGKGRRAAKNTRQVEVGGTTYTAHYEPLWWQEQGLSYTASGYGKAIPTALTVKVPDDNGTIRKYRIYVAQYGNAGTAYIKRGKTPKGRAFRADNIVHSY